VKEFSNKVAVVTGAASGIGRALAIAVARRGCNVAISDVDVQGLTETEEQVRKFGVRCHYSQLDVSDMQAWAIYRDAVLKTFGTVDIIFNVAGVALVDRVESVSVEDFRWLMDINFWGVFYGSRAFLPEMMQRDEAHIVNVSSIFGIMSAPLSGTYNASKFAVRGLTDALKMELSGTPVRVSCVMPGGVKTDIVVNSRFRAESTVATKDEVIQQFAEKARLSPTEAAEIILKGVRRNRRRILVGADARILDVIVRLFPGSYEKLLFLEREVREWRANKKEGS